MQVEVNPFPYVVFVEQAAAPDAPAAGRWRVYMKTDHKMYRVDENGAEKEISDATTTYTHPNHSGDVTSVGDGAQTIAADAVDDTKVGNRVPQFYRRQGGSASNWNTAGDTNYTPGAVRMQCGTIRTSGVTGQATITYPVAFSAKPVVFLSLNGDGWAYVASQSASACLINARYHDAVDMPFEVDVYWLAIGPE